MQTAAIGATGRTSIGMVIGCTSGCQEGAYYNCGGKMYRSEGWSRRNPGLGWEHCRCENKHWQSITNAKYMGCSVSKNKCRNGRSSVYCYLSGETNRKITYGSCTTNRNQPMTFTASWGK